MLKSAKSRAEEQFTASQKKTERVLKEKEQAEQERAKHTARLRALRLAKEAADKECAEAAEAQKLVVKKKKPSTLPQTHRR